MPNESQYTDKHIVAVYKRSSGLREAAYTLGLSHSRVHQVVRCVAPDLLRPRGRQLFVKNKKKKTPTCSRRSKRAT